MGRPKAKVVLAIGAGLAAVTFSLWVLQRRSTQASQHSSLSQPAAEGRVDAPSGESAGVSLSFQAAIRRIRETSDPAVVRDRLNELRAYLERLSPEVASTTIGEFLDSGVDAATHLGFKIGPTGLLTESPTLRVVLLDYLAQVDAPGAAAYAKNILAAMDSPDEWAVALRNYALVYTSSEARSFMAQKAQAMLTHEPWVREPSTGFLEAFDVAVHVGGTNLVPVLADLVRLKDNQAVAHAAYLALDRMTISDAAATLSVLLANPALMEGREATRANFFARSDVGEPAQRGLVEAYLLNPALEAAELEKFAGLYPNANFMISHNLLTRIVTPDGTWLAARDAEALRVVRQWLEDPRFARIKPQVEAIQRRLNSFVPQTRGPR